MARRTSEDEQNWFVCGNCGYKIPYLKSDEKPDRCPECWTTGLEKSPYDLPERIKLDLTKY